MSYRNSNLFDLSNKTAFITGGGGFLGEKHAEAILEAGGNVILADINYNSANDIANKLSSKKYIGNIRAVELDVTDTQQIEDVFSQFVNIDILINNADKDPKPHKNSNTMGSGFEDLPLETFLSGINTSLIGTFLCSQAVISKMNNGGSIINISSDLGIVSPDQRIYLNGTKKPITYSVSKFAIVGMTKYLATYYAHKNIRVNCLCPGGVNNNYPTNFVQNVCDRIPMGRMANRDEYKGAVIFLSSKASSYMTGANLIIDGGRTAW